MLDFSSAGKVAAIALTSGVMGATLIATTYNTPSQERNADALLFLLIFWCFIPLIGAMPYMMLGATDDYISAYFEAVSAFTTTYLPSRQGIYLRVLLGLAVLFWVFTGS